ncbi:bifunctional adenosylcobinamide kinase/adenosylcobinamide-phosphate guanylyltransferase [Microbispora triticiradicis]|uniref:bifunctional adenosylcobinamide kinase/adenosylcobinamide-phosphate guanylyltransferase n=1 Tax=Microbispora triticiradicis TaxID=2200763 RepID=UPI001FCA8066|nr:bifunctional adenosylcobinamide kinase/adenosylcobinamide-phosphate guanylyltransferase [Microbispora triticiradicis]MBO4270385.1 adenosylcobinamide kinase/adenosylcobinamide phosphate guanyltransferase [Microbispora triticiradicis]
MKVRVEGTGGPQGWPVPGCACASCGRLDPGHRRPASVLVDDRVRLAPAEPGQAPETATATAPDTPMAPEAPAAPNTATAPGAPITSDAPAGPHAGAEGRLPEGYRELRTSDGCEITTRDGGRLLYAVGPPSGRGEPDPPLDAPFDVVLIDLPDRPERLGDLRRRGRVTPRTRIVAVHLCHRIPSEGELARRLGFWGAETVPDGAVVDTASTPITGGPAHVTGVRHTANAPSPTTTGSAGAAGDQTRAGDPATGSPAPDVTVTNGVRAAQRGGRPRRTLLLGGSRSGKSEEAELRLAAEPEVTYVATGPSGGDDPDWLARVRAHRDRRPAHWRTLETTDLVAVLSGGRGTFLVDGIGTWLAAVFDECGAWPDDARPEDLRRLALGRVEARCAALVDAWRGTRARVVAVSDETGLGVIPATAAGRLFRDALGRLNQALARESEEVALVVAGRIVPLPI